MLNEQKAVDTNPEVYSPVFGDCNKCGKTGQCYHTPDGSQLCARCIRSVYPSKKEMPEDSCDMCGKKGTTRRGVCEACESDAVNEVAGEEGLPFVC